MNYMSAPGIVEYKPPAELIVGAVLRQYDLTIKEIRWRNKRADLVTARQVICYLLRKHTKLTLQKIGDLVERDHSNVVHSVQKVVDLLTWNKNLKTEIEQIELSIKS